MTRPTTFFGFAALLTLLTLLSVAQAAEIKPVDGDTFWYDGTKLRLSAVDTPEPTKYGNAECPSEAALGHRASAFTKNIITTRKIEIEWSGRGLQGAYPLTNESEVYSCPP